MNNDENPLGFRTFGEVVTSATYSARKVVTKSTTSRNQREGWYAGCQTGIHYRSRGKATALRFHRVKMALSGMLWWFDESATNFMPSSSMQDISSWSVK